MMTENWDPSQKQSARLDLIKIFIVFNLYSSKLNSSRLIRNQDVGRKIKDMEDKERYQCCSSVLQ